MSFDDLIQELDYLTKEFAEIDAIKDPLNKQYILESLSKKSKIGNEAYTKLFNIYQAKKKEDKWIGCWYTAPWAYLEKGIEWVAVRLNEMDIFKIIQQIGNITIVFSVASLIWSVIPNKNQEIEEAWKVVESQDNIRKTKWIALEKLNKYGQSLEYLDLSKKDQNRYGAYLNEINLKGANLYRASLIRALVKEANLEGANLQRSELTGVVFANTNLSRAQLQEADIEQAVFDQANIKEADFRRAKNLNPQQIISACFWEQAIFDEEFQKRLNKYIEEKRKNSPSVTTVDCSRWQ